MERIIKEVVFLEMLMIFVLFWGGVIIDFKKFFYYFEVLGVEMKLVFLGLYFWLFIFGVNWK